MKMAVIYLLPLDTRDDAAHTEAALLEDQGDMLIAHEEALNRERLRRELGEPFDSAIRETSDYRDVDIWEIQSKGRTQ